jgi:hypothetical protein
MSQVFVSHSKADQAVAEKVVGALVEAGLTPSHPASFTPGIDIAQELEHAMRGTDCVVVLWSKAAAASAWAQEEIRLAIEAWSNDRLVLVSLDDTPLPVGLRDLEAIPFGRGLDGRALSDLIERVRAIVDPHERPSSAVEAPAAMRAPGSARRGIGAKVGLILVGLLLVGFFFFSYIYSAPPPTESGVPPVPGSEPWPEHDIGNPTAALFNPWLVLGAVLFVGIAMGTTFAWAGWRWARRRSRRRQSGDAGSAVRADAALADGPLVFVSYSREDFRAVDRLVEQIEQAGYGVWIDRQAHGSQRYAAPIVRAIKTSQLVALMCSRNSFKSDHVIREVYIAGDHKKPFLVFQLDRTEFPDEMLYFISGFPRLSVDALDPQGLRTELSRLLVN